jgi:hypothetical protein
MAKTTKPTTAEVTTGQQEAPEGVEQAPSEPATPPGEPTTPTDGQPTNPAEALMAEKAVTLPQTVVRVFIARVKSEWPHTMLQSAGIIFPRTGEIQIREDAPEYPELAANPYLRLQEVEGS